MSHQVMKEAEIMMKMRTALLVVALFVVSLAVFAQGVRRDGKWEVKVQMDIPGMPGGMPPTTFTQCITPKDAADPLKAMPPSGRGQVADPSCKVQDYKVDGNKVTWSMKCDAPQAMTMTGELVYSTNAYTGTLKMSVGGRGDMTMKYDAKRVGDCPGGSTASDRRLPHSSSPR
jgi:hypothetical protein